MKTPTDFKAHITLYKQQKQNVQLPERNFQIFEFRYGLTDGKPHTEKETAMQFGISHGRVNQIIGKVLAKCAKASDIIF